MIGFVFYGPSPRAVTVADARRLAEQAGQDIKKVGVFVDADDSLLADAVNHVPLDAVQLHGDETPERVREIRRRFGPSVIKAIKVRNEADLEQARRFEPAADMLLFDARPEAGQLPGGNGVPFDWTMLKGCRWKKPWVLSGGLAAESIGRAVEQSGASVVDVSSGVETAPGQKSAKLIGAFLAAVRKI